MPKCKFMFGRLALLTLVLVPVGWAQKPPGPGPGPTPAPQPPAQPSQPSTSTRPTSDPLQSTDDRVLFLGGHVATSDGSVMPNDVLVQRVCLEKERQQVYASPGGDFNMQLGSRNDSATDASLERDVPFTESRKNLDLGIPRRDLANCDLRVAASGFFTRVVNLVEFSPSLGRIDIGSIVLQRAAKVEGTTINAAQYRVPKEARRAYEKGLAAQKNAKTDEARKYFQQAVQVYPNFAEAWFQLGGVLEKTDETTAARAAYVRATTISPKYQQPYLSLAAMALKQQNWVEARDITDHILDIDPLNHTNITGGIWDLDPSNSADAYFYNALANYKLGKFAQAEKSALKAKERVDLSSRYPQLHMLLADIFARKNDYGAAASEIETYLELVPHASDAERLHERVAELRQMNRTKTVERNP